MKKILITFILSFVWFISFCSAQSFSEWQLVDYAFSRGSNLKLNFPDDTNCFFSVSSNNLVYIKYNWVAINQLSTWYYCFLDTSLVYFRKVNAWYTHSDLIFFDWFYSTGCNCQVCEECQECPTIDTNYCVENNLCPSSWWDCPIYTWDSNWSSLYINDIQHESAWTINITIPEEYSWDYTNENDEFNLDIIGYNVDTDYIEWIITNQTTKPNQTDLNNIISWVIPLFIPWLVIILFIYFVFKFLKKIF